ncbi:MAG: hypothetical protein RL259_1739 [Bacteroidota bacterium]|jgi:hypothetical protein
MPRYSLALQNQNSGKVWVKSYRSLNKAKRASAGLYSKTNNMPLLIMRNSIQQVDSTKNSYKKSKGWNYGSWLSKFQKTSSRYKRVKGTNMRIKGGRVYNNYNW